MNPIVETRRSEIATPCERFQVRRLDVFGSAARADFDPARSDVDLAVEFGPDTTLKTLDQYLGLKHALKDILGRQVDLLMASAVRNPYIRGAIEESHETLFAS